MQSLSLSLSFLAENPVSPLFSQHFAENPIFLHEVPNIAPLFFCQALRLNVLCKTAEEAESTVTRETLGHRREQYQKKKQGKVKWKIEEDQQQRANHHHQIPTHPYRRIPPATFFTSTHPRLAPTVAIGHHSTNSRRFTSNTTSTTQSDQTSTPSIVTTQNQPPPPELRRSTAQTPSRTTSRNPYLITDHLHHSAHDHGLPGETPTWSPITLRYSAYQRLKPRAAKTSHRRIGTPTPIGSKNPNLDLQLGCVRLVKGKRKEDKGIQKEKREESY